MGPHCSVAISSPNQPECSLLPSVESNSTTEEAKPVSDHTPAVIGGTVGVIFIIIITIALVPVIFMFLKYHPKGKVSLKRSGEKYEYIRAVNCFFKLFCSVVKKILYKIYLLFVSLCRDESGVGCIATSTNEAYGKVVEGEIEEGYKTVDTSHREPAPPPPGKLEETYEVPLSPAPPSQSLPTIPLPLTAGAEENTDVYEVISGDQ